ncbi:glycosyltransferase family 87 protein [Albidovulum sp.]
MSRADRFAILLLAAWAVQRIAAMWNGLPPDLSAIHVAGWLLRTGRADLIYAMPPGFFGGQPPAWDSFAAAIGGPDFFAFPFVYPPLWAALAAPFTAVIGPAGFGNAVALVQVPLLAASVVLAARLCRPLAVPLIVWAAVAILAFETCAQPMLALLHNQPTLTTTFLVLFALDRLNRGAEVAAGLALALAAAIKLTPALFVLVLVIGGHRRGLAAFALAGAALAGLSLALAGPGLHWAFLEALGEIKRSTLVSIVNLSLKSAAGALAVLTGARPAIDPDTVNIVLPDLPGWIGPALTLAGVLVTAALWRALRQRPAAEARLLLAFGLGLVVPLFGPLGWLHYYLLPLLLLPALLARLPRAAAIGLGAAIAATSPTLLGSLRPMIPAFTPLMTLAGVAVWLAVLAALFAALRRPA